MILWNQEIYYYNTKLDFEAEKLAKRLSRMLKEEKERKGKTGVVILCIGTDRSTGDSLGPLIGYKLKEMNTVNFTIFGTLDRPVHAMNLDEYVNILQRFYRNDLVVAVDASVCLLYTSVPLSPLPEVRSAREPIKSVRRRGVVPWETMLPVKFSALASFSLM